MMQEAQAGGGAAIRVQVLAATGNAAFAEKIALALTTHGYELTVGEFDPKEVDAAVIVWSGASIASQDMLKAAALPLACNALIPVSIGKIEPPPAFRHLEPIDLAGWTGSPHDARWRAVIDEIDKAAYAARLPADAPIRAPSSPWPRVEAKASRAPHAAILASFALMGAAVAGGFYFLSQNRGDDGRTRVAEAAALDAPKSDAREGAPAIAKDEPPIIALAQEPQKEPKTDSPITEAPKTIDADAASAPAEAAPAEHEAAPEAQGDQLADLIASSVDNAASEADAPRTEQVASLSLPQGPAPAAPGGEFKDCDFCPQMARIPAGEFMFGSPTGEPARQASEGPVRRVEIAKPFGMATHEVTFEEWDACVADGGCPKADDAGWGRGKRPVINVSFADAKAYADWLSKKTGAKYRLPTEEEWEYAARGGAKTAFSFGNFIKPADATFDSAHPYGGEPGEARQKTTAVASHAKNAFGLYDMHGNVWEWTADCWSDSHGAPAAGDCKARVLKGGAWNTGGWRLRAAHRIAKNEASREYDNGFRVVRELP